MESDPSLVARIAEWFWAVVWNWKSLVAGLSLASGFTVQLWPGRVREWIDKKLRPDLRRLVLIALCVFLLLISFFQAYDDVSTRLRHAASQLPDFEKVTTWSVSFEAVGLFGGAIPLDNTFPFYLAFHRCRFVNLSATQKRILDLKIEIPTDDPKIRVLVLDTERMSFQDDRESLTHTALASSDTAL